MANRHALLVAPLLLALGGCAERWTGIAYPNRHDLVRHVVVGEFESLDVCRAKVTATLRSHGSDTFKGDYECGLNCKASGGGGMLVCERTER